MCAYDNQALHNMDVNLFSLPLCCINTILGSAKSSIRANDDRTKNKFKCLSNTVLYCTLVLWNLAGSPPKHYFLCNYIDQNF